MKGPGGLTRTGLTRSNWSNWSHWSHRSNWSNRSYWSNWSNLVPPDAISSANPRVIDDGRARKLSNDLKRCTYYETCATYGLNVERVFQDGEDRKSKDRKSEDRKSVRTGSLRTGSQ